MGSEESEDCVYQQLRNGSSNSISDKVAAMSIDPFCSYGPYGWDRSQNFISSSVVSPQNEFANPHFSVVLENPMGNSSRLVHFPSDSGLVDLVPKIPSFGSGDLPEIVSSFRNCQNSENGALGILPTSGRRKRKLSVGVSSKNIEVGEQRDPSRDTVKLPIRDDQNKNIGERSCLKQAVKQAKDDNPVDEEPPKENYVHVRAKRGQAKNSHSLAERVRREKISERMKLLQELVPGCNMITGKAVMLDEIINYVQSLQQQVEFLSMKLATVSPELSVDIDRILSKDILQSRGNNATALIIGLGLSSSHPFPGNFQGVLTGTPGTTPPCHHLPQNIWNSELQGVLQKGFDCNPSISSLGPDGPSKMEL